MTDLAAIAEPPEIRLLRGAMQNWSDFSLGSVADSPVVRRLLVEHAQAGRSLLLAGAHSLDLVTGLAQERSGLTVLTRSIPDATSIAESVSDEESVEVVCGGLDDLVEQKRMFDTVVALDDLTRLVSIEDGSSTWGRVFTQLSSLVADGGRLLVGVENELGLHRLSSPQSRRAADTDADWAVLTTYDGSRPRSGAQVVSRLLAEGLAGQVHSLYPSWLNATLITCGDLDEDASRLLGLLAMRSPSLRRGWADPSRVVRVSAESGNLGAFASGWLVDAVKTSTKVDGLDRARIVEETPVGEIVYSQVADGDLIRSSNTGDEAIRLARGATLLSELFVDACVSHRLPEIRNLLTEYVGWVRGGESQGLLPAHMALAGFENVARSDQRYVVLTPGTTLVTGTERIWRSLGELAAVLRDRGVRHPWPAFSDEKQLVLIMAAMAGLPPQDDFNPSLVPGRPLGVNADSLDPAGLLAAVQRLAETNAALRSRSDWFEARLGERERELRRISTRHHTELTSEQSVQEALREEVAALRASRSYRIGQFVLSPAVRARDLARNLRNQE